MSRLFYHVMQDFNGNLLFDVSGTMRLAGTGTLATIYGDEALTVILPNPMTNHPSYGSFKCFLGAGDYDFYLAKSGYTFETLTGVQGHGTMAQQNYDAVGITGGNIGLTGSLGVGAGAPVTAWQTHLNGPLGVQTAPAAAVAIKVIFNKTTQYGMVLQNSPDTGNEVIAFQNAASAFVGSIQTTATATSFNTSSDGRLKHAITPLTGALDVVRRLRPVAFRWKSDDTPGRGFLAGEVQEVIPDGVITGEAGAVDDDGRILPQMIDYSKLVPYLIGAVKELTQQVEMLQAQLAAVEG